MTVSPYEIVMAPLPDDKSSCEGCLLVNAEEGARCGATNEIACTIHAMPKLAHKVSGVVASDEDLIREYTRHKQEVGLWVSHPMKSK